MVKEFDYICIRCGTQYDSAIPKNPNPPFQESMKCFMCNSDEIVLEAKYPTKEGRKLIRASGAQKELDELGCYLKLIQGSAKPKIFTTSIPINPALREEVITKFQNAAKILDKREIIKKLAEMNITVIFYLRGPHYNE